MQVDIKVAMMISLSIILISLATAVSLVVCCFKHGCPLYDTCSGSYKRTNNIPYGSDYDGSDQVSLYREWRSDIEIFSYFHFRISCRGTGM